MCMCVATHGVQHRVISTTSAFIYASFSTCYYHDLVHEVSQFQERRYIDYYTLLLYSSSLFIKQ